MSGPKKLIQKPVTPRFNSNHTEKSIRVRVGSIHLSNQAPLCFISGLNVLESEELTLHVAERLKHAVDSCGATLIFKSSFDKANRSSRHSFRGPGMKKGLQILLKVKKRTGLPILTDVHEPSQVETVAEVADVLQIPAFLCRQTDLILETAKTGKPVNVKKGQFLSPWEVGNIVQKIESMGNRKVMLTERGTSFGYNNLVVDVRSLEIMKHHQYPVLLDVTHAVQLPGGLGHASGGQREFVRTLARAATAIGVAGIFFEVHPNPVKARCDGPSALPLSSVEAFMGELVQLDTLAKKQLLGDRR